MRPIFLLAVLILTTSVSAQWTQWGGPNRDFTVDSDKLAIEWPESGPKELWNRPLGEGFSGILFEDGRLYTLRHENDNDIVVALDAATGKPIWETPYHSPTVEGMIIDFGPGPISTPLLVGDRLFTIGLTVKLNCLDKKTGKILWSKDLLNDMGASHIGRGYGPSPIAYKNMVIVETGAKDQSIVAFDQATGEIVWKNKSYNVGYSSPILVNVDGEEQLIVAMRNVRAGLNPNNGEVRWQLELPKDASTVMTTQHWGKDNLLFASSAYADGSRVIEVRKKDGEYQAQEVWFNRKMRIMYASYVRIGDYVYGCSGGFGPTFLMAINVKDGAIAWRKRGFSRAHFIHADGKVIILDEDGSLAIATATPEDLTIHSRANVIGRTAWTPPTLVGSTLYLRNREVIKALDLGTGK